MLRRSEINQLNDTFICYKYVVRRYVSVEYAALMDIPECVEHGKRHPPAPLIILLVPGFFQDGLYIHSLKVLHHDISGSVFLEKVGDRHHSPDILESRYAPCFFKKLLKPLPESGLQALIRHGHCDAVLPAANVLLRVKLLDRDLAQKELVPPHIGIPKAAIAQRVSYDELALQDCAGF